MSGHQHVIVKDYEADVNGEAGWTHYKCEDTSCHAKWAFPPGDFTDPRESTYKRAPDPETIARVYDKNGVEIDQCWGWEAAQNYANQGYRVEAVADDKSFTKEEQQSMYDACLAAFRDCFDREWYFEYD